MHSHIYNMSICMCMFMLRFVASVMISFFLSSSGLSSCDIIIHRIRDHWGQRGWAGLGQHLQAESFQDSFNLLSFLSLFIMFISVDVFCILYMAWSIMTFLSKCVFWRQCCSTIGRMSDGLLCNNWFTWFGVHSVINLKQIPLKGK